jgi:hypothetical protein
MMAWVLVFREINYRRPNSRFSFNLKPSPVPQEWPRDVCDYAVSKGAAEQVPSPTPERKRAIKRAHRAS